MTIFPDFLVAVTPIVLHYFFNQCRSNEFNPLSMRNLELKAEDAQVGALNFEQFVS